MMLQAVCLLVSLFIAVLQCQVLDFTRQLTPFDVRCGHLRCVANSSLSIINLVIYDLTEKGNPVKLASISVFAPDVSVDPSLIHLVNATGTISNYAGVLDVRFLRDVDCFYGAFQCELDFFDVDREPDVIRQSLAPATDENETILNTLAKIATQLNEHSQETDKQLEALKNDNLVLKNDTAVLKHDTEVLKNDNEILKNDTAVLKNDNEVLKTILDNVLVELSGIKALLNSTLDKDKQIAIPCHRGMSHTSSREKFFLQGKILALCDTETDGGGWVVIQRRTRGDVDFYRGWDDYKKGFGTPDTDFWIGNDIIHDLSSQGYNELRIDFVYNDTQYFAQYTNFTLANESSAYIITTDGFSGNVLDIMTYHNGIKFSTFDRDNDNWITNCAVQFHGGWWYNSCYTVDLNGNWNVANVTGISWQYNTTDLWTNLSLTEMKIRYI